MARKGLSITNADYRLREELWTLRAAFRSKSFWFMALVPFTNGLVINTLVVHQVAHLVGAGYGEVLAASTVRLVGLLGSVGGILWGLISDRLGREIGYTTGGFAAFIGVLHLAFLRDTSSSWILYSFVAFYGLGHGSMAPITAAKTSDLFPGRSLGKILGILSSGFGLGGALGVYAGGYFYDLTGEYLLSFVLVLFAIGIGVVGIWMASKNSPPKRAVSST